jgi:hypothetical protein
VTLLPGLKTTRTLSPVIEPIKMSEGRKVPCTIWSDSPCTHENAGRTTGMWKQNCTDLDRGDRTKRNGTRSNKLSLSPCFLRKFFLCYSPSRSASGLFVARARGREEGGRSGLGLVDRPLSHRARAS